jgi:hypothetical protein
MAALEGKATGVILDEQRRAKIHELAQEARQAAEDLRDLIDDVPGDAWVMIDGVAADLEELDWQLARETLEERGLPSDEAARRRFQSSTTPAAPRDLRGDKQASRAGSTSRADARQKGEGMTDPQTPETPLHEPEPAAPAAPEAEPAPAEPTPEPATPEPAAEPEPSTPPAE